MARVTRLHGKQPAKRKGPVSQFDSLVPTAGGRRRKALQKLYDAKRNQKRKDKRRAEKQGARETTCSALPAPTQAEPDLSPCEQPGPLTRPFEVSHMAIQTMTEQQPTKSVSHVTTQTECTQQVTRLQEQVNLLQRKIYWYENVRDACSFAGLSFLKDMFRRGETPPHLVWHGVPISNH